jgi:hypothetical protein
MSNFAERGLPHWAVIHAPDDHNDKRNYHLHAVYYDRPCAKLENGKWDFEVETSVKWKNGQTVMKRPMKQAKDKEARGKAWITHLRATWAETANGFLKKEGLQKRYDPRPYRESGIRKMPTAHLGNKLSVAESQGIDTKLGAENARREMRFRLSKPDDAFDQISSSLDKAIAGIRQVPGSGNPRLAMMAALASRQILSAGLKSAKSREANALAVDVIGARLSKRAGFLDAEYDRLTLSPPRWLGAEDAFKIAATLWDERRLIDDAAADISPFRAGCRQAVTTHDAETSKLDQERRSAIEAMLKAMPSLKAVLTESEIEAMTLPLSSSSDRKADENPATREDLRNGAPPATKVTAEQQPAPEKTAAAEAVRIADEDLIEQKTATRTEKTVLIQEAAEIELAGEGVVKKLENEANLEIPGALMVSADADAKTLAKTLEAIEGWQLRYHFMATRDAADFTEKEALIEAHAKAMALIEKEAKARGLDLATGRMDPKRAQDPKAFERHRGDWQPEADDPQLVRTLD